MSREFASVPAQAEGETGIRQDARQGIGEVSRIVLWNEESGVLMNDDVWNASDSRGDEGHSCPKPFPNHVRDPLIRRADDRYGTGCESGRDILFPRDEPDLFRKVQTCRCPPELVFIVPILDRSDELEARVGELIPEMGQCLNEQKLILSRVNRCDAENRGFTGGGLGTPACNGVELDCALVGQPGEKDLEFGLETGGQRRTKHGVQLRPGLADDRVGAAGGDPVEGSHCSGRSGFHTDIPKQGKTERQFRR